jgi:hypothetical protein
LGRYFNDTKGNLYDGHSQNDVTQRMRTNSGENPKDQSALRALAAALRETDLQQRLAAVNKILDLDRFISFYRDGGYCVSLGRVCVKSQQFSDLS